jgi:hypothetical protein
VVVVSGDHHDVGIAVVIGPAGAAPDCRGYRPATIGGGSYGVLQAVAGACAVIGAVAILPVRRAR